MYTHGRVRARPKSLSTGPSTLLLHVHLPVWIVRRRPVGWRRTPRNRWPASRTGLPCSWARPTCAWVLWRRAFRPRIRRRGQRCYLSKLRHGRGSERRRGRLHRARRHLTRRQNTGPWIVPHLMSACGSKAALANSLHALISNAETFRRTQRARAAGHMMLMGGETGGSPAGAALWATSPLSLFMTAHRSVHDSAPFQPSFCVCARHQNNVPLGTAKPSKGFQVDLWTVKEVT